MPTRVLLPVIGVIEEAAGSKDEERRSLMLLCLPTVDLPDRLGIVLVFVIIGEAGLGVC